MSLKCMTYKLCILAGPVQIAQLLVIGPLLPVPHSTLVLNSYPVGVPLL